MLATVAGASTESCPGCYPTPHHLSALVGTTVAQGGGAGGEGTVVRPLFPKPQRDLGRPATPSLIDTLRRLATPNYH